MVSQGSVKWAYETKTLFENIKSNHKEHPTPSLAYKINTNWTQDSTINDTNIQNNKKRQNHGKAGKYHIKLQKDNKTWPQKY